MNENDAATIAATIGALEYAASLASAHDQEELARQLYDARDGTKWFALHGDNGCCPVCEEVDCDEGCPLEPLRSVRRDVS